MGVTEDIDSADATPAAFDRITVADAMHAGVITCPRETTLRTVARMMATYDVHAVVVFDEREDDVDGGLWGIVSDLDLAAGLSEGAIDDRTAGETAANPVVTVTPNELLRRAAQLMAEHATAHLVVLDEGTGLPAGILSTLDVARAAASWDGTEQAAGPA